MQIVPIKDLKDTVSIEKICTETGELVFITKNGYGKLVVMDIELYQKVMKSAYEAISRRRLYFFDRYCEAKNRRTKFYYF